MKNAAIGIAAITALIATPALAADMAVKAPSPAPVYSWTGFYLGLNAGGDWGTSAASTVVSTPGSFFTGCAACIADVAAVGNQHFNTSGFTGGIQGGYNWQSGNWLLGIEADFESFRSSGSATVADPITTYTVTSSTTTDWLLTARPRVGVVSSNWLFYATGGLAVTDLKANWSFVDIAGGPNFESASSSTVRAGGAVGGGIETILFEGWTAGVEYLFVSFGRVSVNSSNYVANTGFKWTDIFTHTDDLDANILRLRLSKKF